MDLSVVCSDNNGSIDFKEFLLAIDVTSAGCPEQKLNWAFRMYDVDGNGVIEPDEMSRIVHSIYAMMGPTQATHTRPVKRDHDLSCVYNP